MELGSSEGGPLRHIPVVTAYFTHSNLQEEAYFNTPAGGRFSPCPAATQLMKSCHNPELSPSANGSF